mmetsp:Transcript_88993/g.212452  ORF Transcript_88993/g.212452 Transcript_88993/m.212452 type:complete len:291 (+) Transcript_88993:131-1003(+)
MMTSSDRMLLLHEDHFWLRVRTKAAIEETESAILLHLPGGQNLDLRRGDGSGRLLLRDFLVLVFCIWSRLGPRRRLALHLALKRFRPGLLCFRGLRRHLRRHSFFLIILVVIQAQRPRASDAPWSHLSLLASRCPGLLFLFLFLLLFVVFFLLLLFLLGQFWRCSHREGLVNLAIVRHVPLSRGRSGSLAARVVSPHHLATNAGTEPPATVLFTVPIVPKIDQHIYILFFIWDFLRLLLVHWLSMVTSMPKVNAFHNLADDFILAAAHFQRHIQLCQLTGGFWRLLRTFR